MSLTGVEGVLGFVAAAHKIGRKHKNSASVKVGSPLKKSRADTILAIDHPGATFVVD